MQTTNAEGSSPRLGGRQPQSRGKTREAADNEEVGERSYFGVMGATEGENFRKKGEVSQEVDKHNVD